MSRLILPSFFLAIVLAVMAAGCQGSPVMPGNDVMLDKGSSQNELSGNPHQLMGYYRLEIDTRSMEIQAVPLRSGDLHFNITNIFNKTMGITVAGVPGQHVPSQGIFTFDITLKHPFSNKPQFTGFDVKGILITPGTLNIGPLVFADAGETRLENADGYTRWWNPVEFTGTGIFGYVQGNLAGTEKALLTATVNPYKYFANALSATSSMSPVYQAGLNDPNGRGVFLSGASNTRRYRIRFPMNPGLKVQYGYAIDASWHAPAVNPPTQIPGDFPIEANQPEAYYLSFAQKVNTLYYDTESDLSGGVFRLQANVHDWQGQLAGNIADQIETVRVFSPGLLTQGEDFIFLDDDGIKARYSADLSQTVNVLSSGNYLFAVRAGTSDNSTYDQGVGSPAPSSDISAWMTQVVEVVDPVCEADSDNSMVEAVEIGLQDSATGKLCYDQDKHDWFYFEIPAGNKATGEIRWYVRADQYEMALIDSDSDYLKGSYNAGNGMCFINIDDLNLPPGEYFLDLNVEKFTPAGPGTILYYLETEIELENVVPDNPVDVSPDSMDCDPLWMEMGDNDPYYLYLAGPGGTWCYYINNAIPILISRTHDPCYVTPAFHYPYIYYWEGYYAGEGGIDVVDYSNINAPEQHEDVLVIAEAVECITMNSEYLYVAVDLGSTSRVRIYDYVTNPLNPLLVNSFQVPHNQIQIGLIEPEGDTALVTMNSDSMRMFDVSDPLSVTQEDTELLMTSINLGFSIEGTRIAKLRLDSGINCYFQMYTYSNTPGMNYYDTLIMPGITTFVELEGNYAYIGDGYNGIQVVDVTPITSISYVGAFPALSNCEYVTAKDGYLYSGLDGAGFAMWDLADPAAPAYLRRPKVMNNPTDGYLSGIYGFFADGAGSSYGALKVINLFDPESAHVRTEVLIDDTPNHLDGYNDLIAVVTYQDNRLRMFDISDPVAPAQFYNAALPAYANSLHMTSSAVYVGLNNGKIKVYDTSMAPSAVFPQADVTTPTSAPPGDIQSRYQYLYVVKQGTSSFWVYDIHDPNAPVLFSTVGIIDPISEMVQDGDYVYFATSHNLKVADVNDPADPQLVGSMVTAFSPNTARVAAENYYAYVSSFNQYPEAVNVWPPDNPTSIGLVFNDPDVYSIAGLMAHDGYLYILNRLLGLRIYDLY